MNEIKHISFPVQDYVYYNFKQKCDFYEIKMPEIFLFFIEKFIDGDFDKELNIPEE